MYVHEQNQLYRRKRTRGFSSELRRQMWEILSLRFATQCVPISTPNLPILRHFSSVFRYLGLVRMRNASHEKVCRSFTGLGVPGDALACVGRVPASSIFCPSPSANDATLVFAAFWAPLARCLPPQQPGEAQSARTQSGAN